MKITRQAENFRGAETAARKRSNLTDAQFEYLSSIDGLDLIDLDEEPLRQSRAGRRKTAFEVGDTIRVVEKGPYGEDLVGQTGKVINPDNLGSYVVALIDGERYEFEMGEIEKVSFHTSRRTALNWVETDPDLTWTADGVEVSYNVSSGMYYWTCGDGRSQGFFTPEEAMADADENALRYTSSRKTASDFQIGDRAKVVTVDESLLPEDDNSLWIAHIGQVGVVCEEFIPGTTGVKLRFDDGEVLWFEFSEVEKVGSTTASRKAGYSEGTTVETIYNHSYTRDEYGTWWSNTSTHSYSDSEIHDMISRGTAHTSSRTSAAFAGGNLFLSASRRKKAGPVDEVTDLPHYEGIVDIMDILANGIGNYDEDTLADRLDGPSISTPANTRSIVEAWLNENSVGDDTKSAIHEVMNKWASFKRNAFNAGSSIDTTFGDTYVRDEHGTWWSNTSSNTLSDSDVMDMMSSGSAFSREGSVKVADFIWSWDQVDNSFSMVVNGVRYVVHPSLSDYTKWTVEKDGQILHDGIDNEDTAKQLGTMDGVLNGGVLG